MLGEIGAVAVLIKLSITAKSLHLRENVKAKKKFSADQKNKNKWAAFVPAGFLSVNRTREFL